MHETQSQNCVVVINTENVFHHLLNSEFETRGFQVHSMKKTQEGVAEIRYWDFSKRSMPAVAVLDLALGPESISRLVGEIRNGKLYKVPIIIAAEEVTKESLRSLMKLDVDAVLLMPFSVGALSQKMLAAAANRRSRRLPPRMESALDRSG